MLLILLAALGIPLWLLAGALGGALLSRRSFKRQPDVFKARLRVTSGEAPGVGSSWPRSIGYVCWVHDVVLLQHGIALVRTQPLAVGDVTEPRTADGTEGIRGLGSHPMLVALTLDDGAVVELVAPHEAREAMVGPFAVALV